MNTVYASIAVVEDMPAGVWITFALATIVLMMVTWRVARRRLRRAGERAAYPGRFTDGKRDTALTVASLVPAALFWGMVLAGSFHGLVAFGRNVLEWSGGAEYLVPGTLDGVSVTFAFLAFRAIHKRRDPGRSQRVVWAASLSSATVNFAYEYGHTHHNLVAALYLAVLSVFGVVIFHEFLAQFEEGAEYVRRSRRPAWGLRWVTSPYSTLCAVVAWENYPPAEATATTVLNALANLDRVRALKRAVADARIADRHARALAAAGRKAELAVATADPSRRPAPCGGIETAGPVVIPKPNVATSVKLPSSRASRRSRVRAVRSGDVAGEDTKVPATAATVAQWAQTWVTMRTNGDATGPLDDDERARSMYRLSARQLRNIRNAARSGALARRAAELGVRLPDGYGDGPLDRVNGHDLADVTA